MNWIAYGATAWINMRCECSMGFEWESSMAGAPGRGGRYELRIVLGAPF